MRVPKPYKMTRNVFKQRLGFGMVLCARRARSAVVFVVDPRSAAHGVRPNLRKLIQPMREAAGRRLPLRGGREIAGGVTV